MAKFVVIPILLALIGAVVVYLALMASSPWLKSVENRSFARIDPHEYSGAHGHGSTQRSSSHTGTVDRGE